MGRVTPLFSNFNAGEWSPELWGRIDLQKYTNACRTQLNFIGTYIGAATRRPGTRFTFSTKNDQAARLIPFEFSIEQAYVIEAGDLYFRFYKDRGRIDTVPGTAYEIVSPYASSTLPNIKWAQSADVLYMVHPNVSIKKLSRTGHTSWSIADLNFLDGPYLDVNVSATTFTPSGTTGAITITASTATFVSTDVGRLIRIKHSTTWGYAKITAFTSTTVVSATVVNAFGATTASKDWRLGAWSNTTGWPSCVTFYEERLYFASTRAQPQTLWASVAGDYENFAPSTTAGVITADSALTFTISDDRVNAIQWLSAGLKLAIGTSGGEFIAQASTLNEALTADNITIRRQTTIGSASINPARINQTVLYVQRLRQKLFEYAYDVVENNATAPEMSIFSRHLTGIGIKEIAYQQEPWSILWTVLDNGDLLGFTYLREQDVLGWSHHQLGGKDVKVLSICCIPGTTQGELWMIVERTVNGATVRYVEYMAYEFKPTSPEDKAGAVFVDSSLEYIGPPATNISGLDHLKGEKVQILVDGAPHPDKTVDTSGSIVLNYPANRVQVGLGYKSVLENLDIEIGAADGTALGKKKRVNKITAKFYNSMGGKIGYDEKRIDDILTRDSSMPMNQSPPLFTGNRTVLFPKGWTRELRIRVEQEQPLPMTVLGFAPIITVVDG